MTKDELERIISKGEGLTVEFKLCKGGLSNSVFETVSAFSNRYGGHLILGVDDNGKIIGINKNLVAGIKNNFINMLNNPQNFSPTQFFSLEEIEINGKLLLWVYIPVNSQVVMFAGKIYDRAESGDIDVSKNSATISQLHLRKSHEYSERKLFPYAKENDFEFERLMPKVRLLAQNKMPDHPWINMSDMDILKSAGLYQKDRETDKFGFNLAAILLFGKEDTIRSCTANYSTDAICRKEDLDRYDDRVIVSINLIEAYEQLIDFIAKHTLDRFYLIDGQSVSIRSRIAREIVSNSLVHREYSSAFPARIIIENDKIITENWNLPKHYGIINPANFTPYPKNPILANFFINIGRADSLGSGIKNLYKFSKIYSGEEPELVENDIFKTSIPLTSKDNLKISDKKYEERIFAYINENNEISAAIAAKIINRSQATARRILTNLVRENILSAVGENKNRKYIKKKKNSRFLH